MYEINEQNLDHYYTTLSFFISLIRLNSYYKNSLFSYKLDPLKTTLIS